MALASYEVSAPGKLMLLGEHAVLAGHWALVCAVTRRVRAVLRPRADDRVVLTSALGQYETTLARLEPRAPFEFVLAVLAGASPPLTEGCDLELVSDFGPDLGLGSSAAVTAAVAGVVARWRTGNPLPEAVFEHALAAVRQVQGQASGADLAAAVYGGIVAYRMTPLAVRPLGPGYPLTVLYSGHKVKTAEVIRRVAQDRQRLPNLYDGVFGLMGQSSDRAAAAIQAGDWPEVGRLLSFNHGLMAALGLTTPPLDALAHALRAAPGILGAKVSGAGLGDCVVGLGTTPAPESLPGQFVPLAISNAGLEAG